MMLKYNESVVKEIPDCKTGIENCEIRVNYEYIIYI